MRKLAMTKRQSGAGLMEVLICLVVLSAGAIAHMKFQRLAYRETGLAAAQMYATELAVEKIEDLRSFAVLRTTAGNEAYQDIATDLGGGITAGSIVVGNQMFNRSWTVVNYYYPAAGAALTTTVPAGNPLPDLKRVTVNLSWLDLNNEVQNFSLSGLIAAADPRNAAGLYQ